jgi:hypothetical protein
MTDLAVANIYPASSGNIMVTLSNDGTTAISGSYRLSCTGNYTDSSGKHDLALTNKIAAVSLNPGQRQDFATGYSRNPSINEMWVSCSVEPPTDDTNPTDDSLGPVKVK